ncbi:hypothetical protein Y032_0117g692 [Ancylostoma ceylanicum]|uniref:Uncharacterized protein n=1 Tax=Ancylostoma ceylanicum TaxID=53326 RepID=A0A016TC28_9BILA|nr:hypothetical protein Y032_0117g692 [Ancylostoma ceylanicum]
MIVSIAAVKIVPERCRCASLVNQFRQRLQIADLLATRRRSSAGIDEGLAVAENGDDSEEHAMGVEGGGTPVNQEPRGIDDLDGIVEPAPAELAEPETDHVDANEPSTSTGPEEQGHNVATALVPHEDQKGAAASDCQLGKYCRSMG